MTAPPARWREAFPAFVRQVAALPAGDWLVLLLGLLSVGLAVMWLGQQGQADKAVIRQGGQVVAELSLQQAQRYVAQGPLGETVIEIEVGRARIAADPSPRQYCVKQGWLQRAGAVAICAPNQVSLSLTGGRRDYDSLGY